MALELVNMQEDQLHKADFAMRLLASLMDQGIGTLKLYFTMSTGAVVLFVNIYSRAPTRRDSSSFLSPSRSWRLGSRRLSAFVCSSRSQSLSLSYSKQSPLAHQNRSSGQNSSTGAPRREVRRNGGSGCSGPEWPLPGSSLFWLS